MTERRNLLKYSIFALIAITLLTSSSILYYENISVTENAYTPDRQDYLEEETEDWISYYNPRDQFHPEYKNNTTESVPDEVFESRPGSGKFCVSLLNERKEPISGKTIPNTTIKANLDGLNWHKYANPFEVRMPLHKNYDVPLDADQFGTNETLPQGDGILDSHCIEWHLESSNFNLSYDKFDVITDNPERIKFVGYHQKLDTWDSNVDPIEDAQPYEEVGELTFEENKTHGQVVGVFQLK